MSDKSRPAPPSSLGKWMRRYSLALVAALGGAFGVAYAATRTPAAATLSAPTGSTPVSPAPTLAPAVGPALVQTAPPAPAAPPVEPARDPISDTLQIAILLDTSSSMDGLINQARSNLWNIVDEMGRMTRDVDGKVRGVKVELALYEYGHSLVPESQGFIRQVLPFTSDLDRVSEELHRLATNGGDEYAGQAIQKAITSLKWSRVPTDLRFIIVAGNESFDQGRVSAKDAMALADKKDIHVQLIHCGPSEPTWDAAAALARTDLMTINQDQVARHIPAPQDDEILQLSSQINDTYVAYGRQGTASKARQMNADSSSARMSKKVAIERAQLKGKKAYANSSWDLVDALEKDKDLLTKTADDQLPAELRGKTVEEKQQLVASKAAARSDLKAKLAKLENERATFLAAERAKSVEPEEKTLDNEVKKAAKKAAAKKGYKL